MGDDNEARCPHHWTTTLGCPRCLRAALDDERAEVRRLEAALDAATTYNTECLAEVARLNREAQAEVDGRVAWCRECGRVSSCDEDRCCSSCGYDLVVLADLGSAEVLEDVVFAYRAALDAATRERDVRGCECSTEDACRFVRERDEARAEVERLRAEQREIMRIADAHGHTDPGLNPVSVVSCLYSADRAQLRQIERLRAQPRVHPLAWAYLCAEHQWRSAEGWTPQSYAHDRVMAAANWHDAGCPLLAEGDAETPTVRQSAAGASSTTGATTSGTTGTATGSAVGAGSTGASTSTTTGTATGDTSG